MPMITWDFGIFIIGILVGYGMSITIFHDW